MQALRTAPAQSKCSIDVNVQVSACCDHKNLHVLQHQTWLAHGSTGLFGLLNAVCHDSAVGGLPWAPGFLILGPRLTDTASEKTRARGQINPWSAFNVSAWCGAYGILSSSIGQSRSDGLSEDQWAAAVLCPQRACREGMYNSLLQKRELRVGNNNTIYYSWKLLLTSSSASKFPCTILFKAML